MAIEFKNVSFSYPNGYVANENLNLMIQEGERVAIVGQNGAGKTTAVKLMNGLHKPSEGDVFVDGVDTKTKTTAQIAKCVGYVFQNPDDQIFNPDVYSEIAYMPQKMGLPEKEIKERVKWAMELTDTKQYRKDNPLDIPYPIRKFISIASVLAMKPKYVILDEPTAGQDKHGIEILEKLMDKLEEEKIGVITITHDMEFVAGNFKRIIAMAHKNIIADGTAEEIFWNEKIVEEAKICKPQIGELSEELNVGVKTLYLEQLVEAIKSKTRGESA
ncbi:putative uncharacterized protein [Dorea sp. CAG:317]|nr:putative uncharacterized protein [Dorea sp. CAG:317]